MSRYAARRDANEPALVTLARQLGAHWCPFGPLDGWIWHPRRSGWLPVEIKRPERESAADEYTAAQRRFLAWAREAQATVLIWREPDDVLRDLDARRAA